MKKIILSLLLLVTLPFSTLRAGSPAARQGDTTAHGGVILSGSPTVLANGKPIARVEDMHTCPQVTGVVPHVGGPITTGSSTVLVNGKPAARVGSAATCVGPPDTVAAGSPTVLIGN